METFTSFPNKLRSTKRARHIDILLTRRQIYSIEYIKATIQCKRSNLHSRKSLSVVMRLLFCLKWMSTRFYSLWHKNTSDCHMFNIFFQNAAIELLIEFAFKTSSGYVRNAKPSARIQSMKIILTNVSRQMSVVKHWISNKKKKKKDESLSWCVEEINENRNRIFRFRSYFDRFLE